MSCRANCVIGGQYTSRLCTTKVRPPASTASSVSGGTASPRAHLGDARKPLAGSWITTVPWFFWMRNDHIPSIFFASVYESSVEAKSAPGRESSGTRSQWSRRNPAQSPPHHKSCAALQPASLPSYKGALSREEVSASVLKQVAHAAGPGNSPRQLQVEIEAGRRQRSASAAKAAKAAAAAAYDASGIGFLGTSFGFFIASQERRGVAPTRGAQLIFAAPTETAKHGRRRGDGAAAAATAADADATAHGARACVDRSVADARRSRTGVRHASTWPGGVAAATHRSGGQTLGGSRCGVAGSVANQRGRPPIRSRLC